MSKQNLRIWRGCTAIAKQSKLYVFIVCTGLSFSSGQLFAQSHLQQLNYDQIHQQITEFQKQNQALNTQQEIAKAQIQQSALWSNPSVSVAQTGSGSNQDRELVVNLSQPLDIFGQRRSAKKLAQLELSQVELNQKTYQAEMQLAIEYLWSQVAISQQELMVSQAQLATSQATLDATKLRYQAGSIARLDYERALLAHVENQRAAQQVELALLIAKKQLANAWGESGADFSIALDKKLLLPTDTQGFVEQVKASNLYQQNLQLQTQRQQATSNYLTALARPNPTVSLGVSRSQTAGVNDTENRLMLGVEVPLNIFDRKQYAQQVVRAKEKLLAQQKQFYQLQNTTQLDVGLTEIRGLEQQYILVTEQQIPLSEQVHQKTLQGFKSGKYSITDVQQASQQLQQQRLNQIQALKQIWNKSFVIKSLALGIDASQVMSADAIVQINQQLWQSTQQMTSTIGAE